MFVYKNHMIHMGFQAMLPSCSHTTCSLHACFSMLLRLISFSTPSFNKRSEDVSKLCFNELNVNFSPEKSRKSIKFLYGHFQVHRLNLPCGFLDSDTQKLWTPKLLTISLLKLHFCSQKTFLQCQARFVSGFVVHNNFVRMSSSSEQVSFFMVFCCWMN